MGWLSKSVSLVRAWKARIPNILTSKEGGPAGVAGPLGSLVGVAGWITRGDGIYKTVPGRREFTSAMVRELLKKQVWTLA